MSYYQESVFVHLFSSDVGQDKIFGGTLSIEEVCFGLNYSLNMFKTFITVAYKAADGKGGHHYSK